MTGSRASSVSVVVSESAGVGSTSRYAPTIRRWLSTELASDELEKQKRRLVCRVQIVEHQHEGPRVRRAPQEGRHGIEEPEARPLGLGRRRRGRLGEEGAELGEELRHVGGSLAKLGSESVRLGIAKVRPQRLHPGPVGGGAAGLPAAADESSRSARSGVGDQLVCETALADTGLAHEQEQPSASGDRVVEALDELGELVLAADERAARPLDCVIGRHRLLRGCHQMESRVLREYRPLELA